MGFLLALEAQAVALAHLPWELPTLAPGMSYSCDNILQVRTSSQMVSYVLSPSKSHAVLAAHLHSWKLVPESFHFQVTFEYMGVYLF